MLSRVALSAVAVISVMRNCCKYKLLEISGLPSPADMRTIELSRTFRQET